MKFKNTLSPIYILISFGMLALTAGIAINRYFEKGSLSSDIIPLSITGITSAYFLFFVFKRVGAYKIKDGLIIYNMPPFSGKIDISQIRKVEIGKTKYVGLKASTAIKGLVIHYNKYDDILLGPKNQKLFVEMLKEQNPNIEFVN